MFYFESKSYQPWIYVPDAFSEDELEKVISYKENQHDATVGDYQLVSDVRRSKINFLEINDKHNWLYEKMTNLIKQMNKEHFHLKISALDYMQFTEYDESYKGHYGQHVDAGFGTSTQDRKLSFSLQLSKPENYEGGELKIYVNNFDNPVIAEKRHGGLTIFRSNIIHEVVPVTKGNRQCLVGWVRGPIFND